MGLRIMEKLITILNSNTNQQTAIIGNTMETGRIIRLNKGVMVLKNANIMILDLDWTVNNDQRVQYILCTFYGHVKCCCAHTHTHTNSKTTVHALPVNMLKWT